MMAFVAEKGFSQLSDAALLESITAKKTWALETLYDRFSARFNGLALRILQDKHLAEDVLQELFMHIWEKAANFDKRKGTPIGWLTILCRNISIDKLRAKTRLENKTSELKESSQHIHPGQSPEAQVDENILQKEVLDILEYIPMEQSIPISMAFFQGMTQNQISTKLKIPLGTIKTRIRLGLRKLRTIMESSQYGK